MNLNKKLTILFVLLLSLLLVACTDEEIKDKDKVVDNPDTEHIKDKDSEKDDAEMIIPTGVILYQPKEEVILSEDEWLKVTYKGIRTFLDENAIAKGFTKEQARIYEVVLYVENKKTEDITIKSNGNLFLDDKEYNEVTYFFEDNILGKTKVETSALLLSYGGELVQVDIPNLKNVKFKYDILPFYNHDIVYSSYEKSFDVGVKDETVIQQTLQQIQLEKEEAEKLKQEEISKLLNIESETQVTETQATDSEKN